MKFGKRGDSDPAGTSGPSVGDAPAAPAAPAVPAEPPLPPVPDSPPPVAEHEVPVAPAEHEVPVAPAGEELPVFHAEPIVEGEAYEVPADDAPPESLTVHQHEPAAASPPFAVAEQPVSVVMPGPGPAPVTTLGDSGQAFASGHAAGHAVGPSPSWQEPMQELAEERPELVVAAAFVGGLLAAMILRRLGS